jgi:hypothetical protein
MEGNPGRLSSSTSWDDFLGHGRTSESGLASPERRVAECDRLPEKIGPLLEVLFRSRFRVCSHRRPGAGPFPSTT